MPNKIIFIDIDGPLIPYKVAQFHPDNSYVPPNLKFNDLITYWKMDDVAVHMLNKLYSLAPYEFVVSSTWASHFNREELQVLFRDNGLEAPFHNKWKTPRRVRADRGQEITDWLTDAEEGGYTPESYLILDDPDSGSSLPGFTQEGILNPDNLIMVDPEFGLSSYDYFKMRKIIANVDLPKHNPFLWY